MTSGGSRMTSKYLPAASIHNQIRGTVIHADSLTTAKRSQGAAVHFKMKRVKFSIFIQRIYNPCVTADFMLMGARE